MVPYARLFSVLFLGLAANRADGPSVTELAPASLASTAMEDALKLDLGLRLPVPESLLRYSIESPLDFAACSATDKGRPLNGRIGSAVVRAASEQLMLPMGAGRTLPVNGRKYLFCLEPHYREPGTGHGPTGWHKGVTVYEQT
jgi:hypothetical protein